LNLANTFLLSLFSDFRWVRLDEERGLQEKVEGARDDWLILFWMLLPA
jgi:hypothetical protein